MARVTLRVQPGASRDRVVGRHGDGWKIAVQAPPVDGKANAACAVLLAELCDAAKSDVTLVRGATSRTKTFEISGRSAEQIERRLEQATTS